jgi:branched-chain amino acid aminotransferase
MAITGMAWINGAFVPAEEAKISIFDSGFIGGVAIFDTLACWHGGLFKLHTHLARFERSAHAAMIPLLHSGQELADLVCEVTRRSGLRDAYVQVLATRGRRPSPSAWSNEPTLIVYAVPYVWLAPKEKIETGISIIIPAVRNWPASVVDPKIKKLGTQSRPGASSLRNAVYAIVGKRARRRRARTACLDVLGTTTG